MQRYGTVTYKLLNKSLHIIWTDDAASSERIDILSTTADYNILFVDEKVIASFYRKTREFFYGEASLITDLLAAKNTALFGAGVTKTDVVSSDEGLLLIQKKENKAAGVQYIVKLLNAKVVYESFETPEVKVELDNVTADDNTCIAPLNLGSFEVMDAVAGRKVSQGDAEYYSLDYLRTIYPIDHIEENDFVVCGSMEEADSRLKDFIQSEDKVKSIDLETTGVNIDMYGGDFITGIVLAQDERTSTYFPFRQDNLEFNLPLWYLKKILDAVNNQPEDVVIVAHNGKFEMCGVLKEKPCYLLNAEEVLRYHTKEEIEENDIGDYHLRIDADTYVMSVLENPKQRVGLHSLKGRTYSLEHKVYLELDNIFKNKNQVKFNVLPKDIIKVYACPDPANTIKLYNYLIKKIPATEKRVVEFENKLVEVKAINEFYGLRVDIPKLHKKKTNAEFSVKRLGDIFREIHHTVKNINSCDVRRDIFYNQLRCPVVVRTRTGQPSTSVVALDNIIASGTLRDYNKDVKVADILDMEGEVLVSGDALKSNRYPSLVILGVYAKQMKELSAYNRLIRTSTRDRVQFYINQVGAESGRQTSDAHQYSDGMKELVLADSDQHYLWSADYKQMELRVLAYLAKQQDLIELETDPCVDVHRAILSIITGKPMWAISEKERKKGKTVNFGVVYLMSEYGLVKKRYGPKYTEEELTECRDAITEFYNSLPNIKRFIESNKEFIRKHGYIETEFGRRRLFPEVLDPEISARVLEQKLRAGNNTPVQGFGADILKIDELNIQQYIKDKGWDELVNCDGVMLPKVRLMLSIHDEVLVSSHKSVPIEEIIEMFKVCMEIEVKGAPPFFSAPAMINNWYDGKNPAYEIDIPFRDQIVEAWRKDKTSILHPETYLEDLNNYRSKRLRTYMNSLIAKYKTVDEVAAHVDDPELTHTLIEAYLGKESKKFEHLDAIHEATQRFMDGSKEDFESVESARMIDEAESNDFVESITSAEDLNKYIKVNDKGELIEEALSEYEDEEDLLSADSYIDEKEKPKKVSWSKVQFTLYDVLVDISDCETLAMAEPIHRAIAKISKNSESYNVAYIYRGVCRKTDLKVGYADRSKIEEILRSNGVSCA